MNYRAPIGNPSHGREGTNRAACYQDGGTADHLFKGRVPEKPRPAAVILAKDPANKWHHSMRQFFKRNKCAKRTS